MSWSISQIGKKEAVKLAVQKYLEGYKCSEPEETIRQQVGSSIITAIDSQAKDIVVKVTASGSQSTKYDPLGHATGEFTNNFSVEVVPVYGFVE